MHRLVIPLLMALLVAQPVALADEVAEPAAAAVTASSVSRSLGFIKGALFRGSTRGLDVDRFDEGVRAGSRGQADAEELRQALEGSTRLSVAYGTATNAEAAPAEAADPGEARYQLGLVAGDELRTRFAEARIEADVDAFLEGVSEGLSRESTSPEIARRELEAGRYLEQQRLAGAEETLAASKAFLAGNARRPDVVVTRSGLQYEVLHEGSGERPTPLDQVTVYYRHMKPDGTLIYDSREHGHTETMQLRGAIPEGWKEAFLLMRVGSRYRVYLPPGLGFGEEGSGTELYPNEVVVSDFELVGIVPPAPVVNDPPPQVETAARAPVRSAAQ